MNSSRRKVMSLNLTAGLIAAALPLAATAAPESFTVDPYHSFPYFEVVHLNTSVIRGHFEKISGKMTLDTAAKTGAIELSVPTTTNRKSTRLNSSHTVI